MKKFVSCASLVILLFCLINITAFAEQIPKSWARPKIFVEDDTAYETSQSGYLDGFKLRMTYSVDEELADFLMMSPEAKITNYELTNENVTTYLQIDWSIDNTEDWKYNEAWDIGQSQESLEEGEICYWEYYNLPLYGAKESQQTFFNIKPVPQSQKGSTKWWDNSSTGFKRFLENIADYGEDESDDYNTLYYISLNEHTIYVRARVYTMFEASGTEYYITSPWSRISALGKDSEKFVDTNDYSTGDKTEYYSKPVTLQYATVDSAKATIEGGQKVLSFQLNTPKQISDGQIYFRMVEGKNAIVLNMELQVDGKWVSFCEPSRTIDGGKRRVVIPDEYLSKMFGTSFRVRYSYKPENSFSSVTSRYSKAVTVQVDERLLPKETRSWQKASDWARQELITAKNYRLIPDCLYDTDMTQQITRREFAATCVKLYEAMLYQYAPIPDNNPFKDTSDVDVLKAYGLSVVNGTSEDIFSPDESVTREQAAAMLARTMLKVRPEIQLAVEVDRLFDDDYLISDYAKESVYYMVKHNIVNGIGENKFAPRNTNEEEENSHYANATREQAVIIAKRAYYSLK